MSGIPYLGSKISLISKSEIRYEGILVDVNPQESTITFEQVRFFGTEGRRPGDEIAPMDKVFDCVVFRSADIKDLQVYETPKEENKEASELPDPAVVSFASNNKSGPSGFQYQSASSTKNDEVKIPKVTDYASAANANPSAYTTTHDSSKAHHSGKSYSTRGRSNNYQNNNGNFNPHHQNTRNIVVPKSEFDFCQSNAKFSKEDIAGKESLPIEELQGPIYNKNLSFFDDISCQTNTESSRQTDRNRNERNLNMETFGQAAPPRRNYRGGRGRGGYYRGNGNRGGYNNNYNRDQTQNQG